MLEASVRGAHLPNTTPQVLDIVSTFSLVMPLLFWTEHPCTVPAFVSYISTLQKLLSSVLLSTLFSLQQPRNSQRETNEI